MRVAITSQNFLTISGHAGKARRFLIFESGPNGEPMEVERLDLPMELSFQEFHGVGEHPVDGTDVLVTQSCGAGFVRRLAARGIEVQVTSESNPINAARAVLAGEPLPAADAYADPAHRHPHAGVYHHATR